MVVQEGVTLLFVVGRTSRIYTIRIELFARAGSFYLFLQMSDLPFHIGERRAERFFDVKNNEQSREAKKRNSVFCFRQVASSRQTSNIQDHSN